MVETGVRALINNMSGIAASGRDWNFLRARRCGHFSPRGIFVTERILICGETRKLGVRGVGVAVERGIVSQTVLGCGILLGIGGEW